MRISWAWTFLGSHTTVRCNRGQRSRLGTQKNYEATIHEGYCEAYYHISREGLKVKSCGNTVTGVWESASKNGAG